MIPIDDWSGVMEYPKIKTLFDRNEDFTVDTQRLRLPEFGLVTRWHATEKIDGTNVRVYFGGGDLKFFGRTDNAQMHPSVMALLQETFTVERLTAAFPDADEMWLFGEAYGPKVQSGGAYRATAGVRLFDVKVGDWWLNWGSVEDVASKLDVPTVPVVEAQIIEHIVALVQNGSESIVAKQDQGVGRDWEGVVCRTDPLLFTRRGERLMWKLKHKDFKAGKR